MKQRLIVIGAMERRSMSNLLRLIIKNYLAENPEILEVATEDEYAYFPVATNIPIALKNQFTLISESRGKDSECKANKTFAHHLRLITGSEGSKKNKNFAHHLRLVIKQYVEEYERTHS